MLEQDTFVRYVQECLAHLHDLAYLEAHALARLVPDAATGPGEALRRALVDAIDRLKPVGVGQPADSSAQWRRWRYLRLRYEDGLTLQQVARELRISSRQASRDQQQATYALANLLWARFTRSHDSSPATPGMAPPPARNASADGGEPPAREAELVQLAAATVEAPTELGETVRGVATTMAPLVAGRGVDLEVSISDTVSPVQVSRTLLRQALFNLLSYAIELGGGARILLTGVDTARGVELCLDVRRRRGRPPTKLIESRDRPDVEGLLAAGRRLLESQGGALEVQRHADGSLTIDAVLPPVQMRRVLVIDDNPDVVALFRRYLRHAHYRLVHASTAEGALRLAAELKPDVVTLDLMMPSQDGWEILQQLRSCEATRSTPIIVCSVLPERALARSLGVTEFLPKPVTQESLSSVLARCSKIPVREARPDSPGDSASPLPR